MTRETCRYPSCDNEVGKVTDNEFLYRESKFCSPTCDVKYDHLKADARDAQRAEQERMEEDNDLGY